jgi:hypothetical protein
LEWGSGGSTVYFTKFLREHNIEACIALYDLKTSGAGSKNTHEGAYDAWLVALMTEKLRHLEQVERSRKC